MSSKTVGKQIFRSGIVALSLSAALFLGQGTASAYNPLPLNPPSPTGAVTSVTSTAGDILQGVGAQAPGEGLGVGIPGGPSAGLGASTADLSAGIGAQAAPGLGAGAGASPLGTQIGAGIPSGPQAEMHATPLEPDAGMSAQAIPGVDAGLETPAP